MAGRHILVVDDDASLRRVTQVQLEDEGYTVATAPSGEEALTVLARKPQDLVITDLSMPDMSGVDLLRTIRLDYPETTVVLVTAFGSVASAVEAMRLGAFDYITKPVNPDSLRFVVAKALEHLSLREEVHALRQVLDQKPGFEAIIGHSKILCRALEMAARAAQSDVTVLIRGETGTGKELVAQGIHCSSGRRTSPFVIINCGAIPRDLLESELFGHTKGAFTGAIHHKKGKIEIADGGTVFLDEIAELPLELQVKLLGVIQDHQVEMLGATDKTGVDVRIIAATHRSLRAMIADGRFREDLYYRLNVVSVELPPLRKRMEDLPELVQHFFTKARQKHGRPDLKLPASLLPSFAVYHWPGNIRELENSIERLVVLAAGDEISAEDLPPFLTEPQAAVATPRLALPANGISLEAIERELIRQALIKSGWNQTHAAKNLGLTRKTLLYRMEKFGLRSEVEGDHRTNRE